MIHEERQEYMVPGSPMRSLFPGGGSGQPAVSHATDKSTKVRSNTDHLTQ